MIWTSELMIISTVDGDRDGFIFEICVWMKIDEARRSTFTMSAGII